MTNKDRVEANLTETTVNDFVNGCFFLLKRKTVKEVLADSPAIHKATSMPPFFDCFRINQ